MYYEGYIHMILIHITQNDFKKLQANWAIGCLDECN